MVTLKSQQSLVFSILCSKDCQIFFKNSLKKDSFPVTVFMLLKNYTFNTGVFNE